MNKTLLLATIAVAALSIGSNAALAGHHEGGDHKGKMMEKIDTNGDGMISKAEFMAKHEEKFTKMDANNDDMLSMEEMKEAKEAMKEKWKDMKKDKMEMKDAE